MGLFKDHPCRRSKFEHGLALLAKHFYDGKPDGHLQTTKEPIKFIYIIFIIKNKP